MRDSYRIGRRSLAGLVFLTFLGLGVGSLALSGCGSGGGDHADGGGADGSAGGAGGLDGAPAGGVRTAGLQFNGTISFFKVLP